MGCSPWGHWESDMTERLHFHFSLSCIGEGNGNPLQCSCLENPRDGGAWWAAVYGVAQSWTRLKRLSSSSSGSVIKNLPTNVGAPCLIPDNAPTLSSYTKAKSDIVSPGHRAQRHADDGIVRDPLAWAPPTRAHTRDLQ